MRELSRREWNPLDVFDEMRRTFEGFFGEGSGPRYSTPPVDIRQEKDRYVVEADLPGMTEKDVDVRVEHDLLTISSHMEEERREEKPETGYLIHERRRSAFQRSFMLPNDADREHIDARFHNGLLTIDIPKSGETRPRQIEVKKA